MSASVMCRALGPSVPAARRPLLLPDFVLCCVTTYVSFTVSSFNRSGRAGHCGSRSSWAILGIADLRLVVFKLSCGSLFLHREKSCALLGHLVMLLGCSLAQQLPFPETETSRS